MDPGVAKKAVRVKCACGQEFGRTFDDTPDARAAAQRAVEDAGEEHLDDCHGPLGEVLEREYREG